MQETVKTLPLAGVRIVEFTHMVMGPTCGMVLARGWLIPLLRERLAERSAAELAALLRGLGYTNQEIAVLHAEGVVL
jgi:crotonobetainyl-CoA:carnitine CoA-transferase CaiB-like acyl-CoA transferase